MHVAMSPNSNPLTQLCCTCGTISSVMIQANLSHIGVLTSKRLVKIAFEACWNHYKAQFYLVRLVKITFETSYNHFRD